MTAEIVHGTMEAILATIPDNTFDGSFSDPPYGLSFMGKAWDYDVPPKEAWAALYRVLKPGAHLFAFGGPRTYHRLVCAIEDSGFEVRDMAEWLYGTGSPKAVKFAADGTPWPTNTEGGDYCSALKGGHEPICLARKPFKGSLEDTFRTLGTGCLALEASRLERGSWPPNVALDEAAAVYLDSMTGARPSTLTGRAAAGETHANPSAATPAAFFGMREGGGSRVYADSGGASRFFYNAKASTAEKNLGLEDLPLLGGGEATGREEGSIGTRNMRAGAGRGGNSRNPHPTVKPLALCKWLAGLILPPFRGHPRVMCTPYAGVGSEMIGAKLAGWDAVLGIEADFDGVGYIDVARRRIKAHLP